MSDTKVVETRQVTDGQLTVTMAKQKRTKSITIRLEEKLFQLASTSAAENHAGDISNYLRGVIIADLLSEECDISGIEIPGWLVGKRIDVEPLDSHVMEGDSLVIKAGKPRINIPQQSEKARSAYERHHPESKPKSDRSKKAG